MEAVPISNFGATQSLADAIGELVPPSDYDFRIVISLVNKYYINAYVDIFRKGRSSEVVFARSLAKRMRRTECLQANASKLAEKLEKIVLADLPRFFAEPQHPLQAGAYDILFPPGHGGLLIHEAIGHMLERRKNGLLSDKLGEAMAPEFVTIADDPTQADGFGSFDADSLGETAVKKTLIRNGRIESFLEVRGNSRRESLKHIPAPRMSNTYMESANMGESESSLIEKAGVGVRSLGGGRVDHKTGRFEILVREAWRWLGNKQVQLRPFLIHGTAIHLLKNLRSVAGAVEFYPSFCHGTSGTIPVSYGQPWLLVANLDCSPLRDTNLPWRVI